MMICVFQNFKNSLEMRQNSSGEAKKWIKRVEAIQKNVFLNILRVSRVEAWLMVYRLLYMFGGSRGTGSGKLFVGCLRAGSGSLCVQLVSGDWKRQAL